MEAAELGLFMFSACLFAIALEYPASPLRQAIADPFLRRLLMGLAMGLTAVAIIYSPWGKHSGAHFNPAVTLTFYRLGKIAGWDALFYVAAQFAGGVAGTLFAAALVREPGAHVWLRSDGAPLDSALDLLHRAAAGDVASGPDLSSTARRAQGPLRQAAP